jgi:diguanylate cyclase (GGDEF)-like protein/PAS domain S-box-containing protein
MSEEQRFQKLISHNNAIIIQVDPESGKILDANESACKFYGWSQEALCTMTIQEINQLSPDEVALERESAFREERNYFIFPHRLANGETRMVEVHSTPVNMGTRSVLVSIIHDITQRIRNAEQIERLMQEQDAILNSRIVGIVKLKDRDFVWTNTAFAEMLGYTKEEMIGQNTRINYLSDEAYADLGCAAYPVMQRGEIFRTEIQLKRKDGQSGWFELSGGQLGMGIGESIWAFVDISKRKQSEHELRQFQAIIECTDDAIISKSLIGTIESWNRGAVRIFGYQSCEVIGQSITMMIPPDHHDEESSIISRLARGDHVEPFETVRCHKSGRLINVSQTSSPILDELGRVVGVSTVSRDITEHVRAESELRIAATAFESQEGMSVTDANGTILRVNRAFTHITGYTAEDVVGKNSRVLKSGHHDASFYDAMWKRINSTGEWRGEVWNRRKGGEIYPEQLTITAVKDANGVVTNYVSTMTDNSLTKESENKIKHLAFYDPLTYLPNRRLLQDRLYQAMASIKRSDLFGALLYLDLDNFKILNDTLGHDIGDILLQQVAKRLESCVREGDTVARLGGDEFVVMLENLSSDPLEAAEQTRLVGRKILSTLNQAYKLANQEYLNTPSIGATLFNKHSQSIEEILKQADIAMYQAKKSGRNSLQFFDPEMLANICARASLESELRVAIEQHQFELYYQIQVDDSDRPLGAEALIRWSHPERGFISPAQFIPLAEETGLILPIGRWVLETACAQLAAWQKNELTCALTLSVNVSARQFHEVDFVDQVRNAVQLGAINPALLKLEPTESILLEDIGDAVATMNALKGIGVQFALDDFGTGFSSLQYLKILPLNQLKIDQSFVRDMVSGANDQAIVCTIIAMAKSLNLEVIAEGVETEAQRQLLQRAGCNHFQGYLFGKPLPIALFEASLKVDLSRTWTGFRGRV